MKYLFLILFCLNANASYWKASQILGGDGTSLLDIDSRSLGTHVIDTEHDMTHDGKHFFTADYLVIANATPVYFMFITPVNTPIVHAKFGMNSNTEFDIEILEGATTSASGTAITMYNNDRNSATTSALSAYSGPTVTTEGTRIWRGKVGSGKSTGVSQSLNYEIIAKKNTKYLFKITRIADAVGDDWIDYTFYFYQNN